MITQKQMTRKFQTISFTHILTDEQQKQNRVIRAAVHHSVHANIHDNIQYVEQDKYFPKRVQINEV
jgi:hypothetical protein